MIIVQVMGGLGNQLFQYALGLRLAFERRTPLKLDIGWFKRQTLRSYQLDALKIRVEIASPHEIEKFTRVNWGGLKGRAYQAVQQRLPYFYRRVVMEKGPFFDPNVINKVSRNAYLIGYWQAEKYFHPIVPLLREEIKPDGPFSPGCKAWGEKISGSKSTSLHVRRGDYVKALHTNQVHGTCSLAYYAEAISYIRQRFPEITVYIFSDDMDWATQNFCSYPSMEFVELDSINRDQEELLLMSLCDHHIIANSSYSWWGAWLGTKPEKIVIAPQKWFNDTALNPTDLIPENWIRF